MECLKSIPFISILVFYPIVYLKCKNKRVTRNVFCLINLCLYYYFCKDGITFILAMVWLLIPYLYTKKFRNKVVIICFIMVGYIYFMQYEWLVPKIIRQNAFSFEILGISYIVFRQISYVVQYEGIKDKRENFKIIDYLNYMLSFYTLLCGPILRYEEFITDFYQPTEVTEKKVFYGINRVLNGYLKVFLMSKIFFNCSEFFFELFSSSPNIVYIILLGLFNAWYIYFNFSGYCDIMMGFASLCGMRLKENFNKPYLSVSIAELWNRWHISLSEWIRDYVYYPVLKGALSKGKSLSLSNKITPFIQYIVIFLTFVTVGIWHGTNFNYVIFGLLQGTGIVTEMIIKKRLKKKLGKKRYKEFRQKKEIIIIERAITWTYFSVSTALIGWDIVGVLFC